MAGLPTRQILSPSHLKAYLESDSCRKLLKFLGKLCIAIIDKTNHPNAVAAEARLTSTGDQKKETDSSSLPPVIQVLEKYVCTCLSLMWLLALIGF